MEVQLKIIIELTDELYELLHRILDAAEDYKGEDYEHENKNDASG